MKTTTPDPLSSEERALATLLARVAPHGVPSPEIDASILSASHDAVAGNAGRPRRPRWPVAMGLAASMVLAVGVAWQLRPPAPEVVGVDAVPVEGRAPAEVSKAVAASASQVAPSEPADAATVDEVIERSAAVPGANRTLVPPRRQAGVERPSKAATAPELPAPARASPAPAAAAAPVYMPSSPPAPPAPPAPPSDTAERSATASAGIQRPESARQAGAALARSEADSAAAITASERRELRVAPSSERLEETATSAANGAARARRTELQVPVAADAQLQVDDWLERVRTRYGLGDEDAARRSLVLFVQDHPTEPVPDDLEPLLDE